MRNLILVTVIMASSIAVIAGEADLDRACAAYQRGDHELAAFLWERPANAGNAEAQYGMALVAPDAITAEPWIRKAAERGHPGAALRMAYFTGKDPSFDRRSHDDWLRLAADNGSSDAAFNVGLLSLSGAPGHPKNCEEAIHYLTVAAELGDLNAHVSLAFAYRNGECVDQDVEEGARWAEMAARQGQPNAAREYAGYLVRRDGANVDHFEVAVWLGVFDSHVKLTHDHLTQERFDLAMEKAASIREKYEAKPVPRCP